MARLMAKQAAYDAPQAAQRFSLTCISLHMAIALHGTGVCGQQGRHLIPGCGPIREAYEQAVATLAEFGDALGVTTGGTDGADPS